MSKGILRRQKWNLSSCADVLAATTLLILVHTAHDARAETIVSDPFSDGGRTNGSDPSDINWFFARSLMGGTVANDSIIGNGNALAVTRQDRPDKVLAPFPIVSLGSQAGSRVSLSFDFHLSGNLNLVSQNIRFGLFNSSGTPVTADNWFDTVENDDRGYFVEFNVAPTGECAMARANTGPLGGPGLITLFSDGSPSVPALYDTTMKHSAAFAIERNADMSVLVSASLDGYTGSVTDSSSSLVASFDEIGISYGGSNAASATIVLDNVTVESTTVPEPSTFVISLLLGIFGIGIALRRRRRLAAQLRPIS